MQNKTKLMLAGALAAVIAVSGAASAHRIKHGGMQGGGMHEGGMEQGRHGGGMMRGMLERYDANKDGNISKDEVDQNRTSWLTEFDTDKNGTLSLQEFQALWLKARNEEMVREFQQFDKDGNGQVTLDEYKEPVDQMVTRMDRNGDGMIGKDDRMMGRDGKRHQMPMQDDDGDGDAGSTTEKPQ